jgi:hypothetical protein
VSEYVVAAVGAFALDEVTAHATTPSPHVAPCGIAVPVPTAICVSRGCARRCDLACSYAVVWKLGFGDAIEIAHNGTCESYERTECQRKPILPVDGDFHRLTVSNGFEESRCFHFPGRSGSRQCKTRRMHKHTKHHAGIDMEIWRYGDMEIWRYGDMEIWRYGDMEIWRYGDMEI